MSEARWRALAEQASDAILVTDERGRVIQANERACRLLDRPLEAILGHAFAEFIEPDDLERVPLRLAEIRAGTSILQDRPLLRGDGSLVATELSARMLDDGRILAIVRDVTERAELEEERRRALRSAATERLAAGVAHDFDRVLAAIAGYGEHLLGRLDGDVASRGLVERIGEATARAPSSPPSCAPSAAGAGPRPR